jgi:hypothetical protein
MTLLSPPTHGKEWLVGRHRHLRVDWDTEKKRNSGRAIYCNFWRRMASLYIKLYVIKWKGVKYASRFVWGIFTLVNCTAYAYKKAKLCQNNSLLQVHLVAAFKSNYRGLCYRVRANRHQAPPPPRHRQQWSAFSRAQALHRWFWSLGRREIHHFSYTKRVDKGFLAKLNVYL